MPKIKLLEQTKKMYKWGVQRTLLVICSTKSSAFLQLKWFDWLSLNIGRIGQV